MFSFPCHFSLKITSNTRAISSFCRSFRRKRLGCTVWWKPFGPRCLSCVQFYPAVYGLAVWKDPWISRRKTGILPGFLGFLHIWMMADGGEGWKPNYMSLIPFTTKKSCVPFFAVGSPKWNLHANPCNSSPLGDVTMLFCPPIGWWIFGILEISGVGILHGWGASFGRNQQTKHVRMVKWEQERKKKIHHQWTDAFPWLNIFQNLSGLFHVGKILAKG